jgi:hypothetical protein
VRNPVTEESPRVPGAKIINIRKITKNNFFSPILIGVIERLSRLLKSGRNPQRTQR